MSTESKYYEYNPEKRNIFIETHKGRQNHAGDFIFGFFMMFASHASAIVEVFLRKRFGERYITFSQSITLFFVLNFGYAYLDDIFRFRLDGDTYSIFIFSTVFLVFSIRHRMEVSKYGTAYDFKRFSLSDGETANFWSRVIGKKFLGIKISSYHVHTLLEPAIPVIIGIPLLPLEFTRPIGVLLIICGIIFGIRNFSKAQKGRNWVLDNIDKKITNEMKYDVFIGRKPKQETKGVYLPIDLPEDEGLRKSLYNMVEDSFSGTNDLWENDSLDDDSSDNGSESSDGFAKESGGVGNGFQSDNHSTQSNGETKNDSGGAGNG
ncbi:hypothetical protein [Flavivirga jejuensis]|uniref:Uncharacterized protein n=1 Tax=Flavivirga jejuensis TaxID=870487 RepID=A0ABT8WRH8_9FLAO|nr:hypothetical protein [Flavivirga jejuensis]MDO5975594.1 hypothetical protein [Flavivirga jejuensis]